MLTIQIGKRFVDYLVNDTVIETVSNKANVYMIARQLYDIYGCEGDIRITFA